MRYQGGDRGRFLLDLDGHPFYLYGDVKVPVDPDTPQVALHDDPGFEDASLTDWYLFWQVNGSAVSSTARPMAEERCVLVTLSAAGNQAVITSTVAVEPGDDVEFWVFAEKLTGAPTIRGDLLTRASGTPDYFDAPDTKQQTGPEQTLTGTYAKYSQTFTVPDGHTVARMSFNVTAPAAASAYLDSSGSRLARSSAVENVVTPVLLPANVAVTATSSGAADTLTDLEVTLDSPGVSAVYAVTLDATAAFAAATSCVLELHVDGVKQTGQPIFSAATGLYGSTSRTWMVTGLSLGAHTFSAKAYLLSATTVTMAQDHTVLTVTRMQ